MSTFTIRCKAGLKKERVESPTTKPAPRIARQLALAHYIERLVEQGVLKDYAQAARRLGISRARMTQVMNLLNLAVGIQEGILLGDLEVSERQLRTLLCNANWPDQLQRFRS